ncbi:methyltransferase [Thermaurantiacus sp.]
MDTRLLMASLRNRLADLRNRVLMDARFQRLASRFPLTRPVARVRARSLFDLSVGLVSAQVFAAAVELRLMERLADGPLALADLAARLNLQEDAAFCLVVASEGLGLVERCSGNRVRLGRAGAEYLANPGIAAMVAHHRMLVSDLAQPADFLRRPRGGGALARFWTYAAPGHEGHDVGPYSRLMAASQPLVAEQALAAYPFQRHRCILDIGGGEGAFIEAVAQAHPGPRFTLFDLPPVAERARARLGARLGHRFEAIGGDFRSDSLPQGADLVTLVRILHDHDDDVVLALLRAIRSVLAPGGRLLVIEPMAGTRGAGTVAAYFSFYLRAMGSGRPRTAMELRALLERAGFGRIRERPTPLPVIARLIEARAATV